MDFSNDVSTNWFCFLGEVEPVVEILCLRLCLLLIPLSPENFVLQVSQRNKETRPCKPTLTETLVVILAEHPNPSHTVSLGLDSVVSVEISSPLILVNLCFY